MASKQGKNRRHPGQSDGKKSHAHLQVVAPTAVAPAPDTIVQMLMERLGTETLDEAEIDTLADQLNAAAPEGNALEAFLDSLAARLDPRALVVLLESLLPEPMAPAIQEHIVRLIERTREPLALEALVTLGEHGQTRALRRAAKGAIFRLRQEGVTLPEPERAITPQKDAASWPVVRAWANRVDCIGSQAVGLARRRPLGDLAFISVVVSDDRGVVNGMGDVGASPRSLDTLAQSLALPPGAPLYEVTPEYVCLRIRQGLATCRQVGRSPAPDYLRWAFLLAGIDDTWEPDLETLCREQAQPDWLERTTVLIYALEYSDWWPDPEADGREGKTTRRFLQDVEQDLDRLPNRGRTEAPDFSTPPHVDMLSETDYIAMIWPFNSTGTAAIEARIDQHFDAILPAGRLSRYRDALLQMGYLADMSNRPTLCALVLTAAWGLDPASGVEPRRHPFLRQMLRKVVEVGRFG